MNAKYKKTMDTMQEAAAVLRGQQYLYTDDCDAILAIDEALRALEGSVNQLRSAAVKYTERRIHDGRNI